MIAKVDIAVNHLVGLREDGWLLSVVVFYWGGSYNTLRVAPSDLSLMGVLVDIAPSAFLSLRQKEVVKADDIANILLIGKQIAENWLRPAFPALRGWNIPPEQKISNPAQAHTGEVLLIKVDFSA